ncbi:MarR family winged helix-turn-helix transcriptional regulator [Bacillus alkalicellulosilyticus]|uniref:MarR family winged helix-turn-helix transcriptional regulator n=1 Tax=Alkalihalobacterium alkalicellulosilyticum TaxID=1912214 RepID=UPI000997EDFE|nr:MarR family transcriptional regulator [Bacillus alkalicellulosilyticus]
MNKYEELIVSLKEVHEQMIGIMAPSEEEGITYGQMFLLFYIHSQEKIKTTDISNHFGITPGAATAIADKLETSGLIERIRDIKDRRIVLISLSEKGRLYVERKKKENINKVAEVLKELSDEEIVSASKAIQKISKTMAKQQK